jgi:hypothetical protein
MPTEADELLDPTKARLLIMNNLNDTREALYAIHRYTCQMLDLMENANLDETLPDYGTLALEIRNQANTMTYMLAQVTALLNSMPDRTPHTHWFHSSRIPAKVREWAEISITGLNAPVPWTACSRGP